MLARARTMKNFLSKKPSPIVFLTMFLCALAVRALVFYTYVQHEERYCQSDSLGYHICAIDIARGNGMTDVTGKPHFWRTPGYPALLAPCYDLQQAPTYSLAAHEDSIIFVLWIQIIFCSLLPILFYFIGYFLTHSTLLGYILAFIGIIHPGSVLASAFLLTDGPGQVFFSLFLMCFFRNFRFPRSTQLPYLYLTVAALALSAYTWMRPMGQFVALGAAVIMLLAHYPWKENVKRTLYFLVIFFVSIMPWYVRNYNLTGKLFFCPLFGLYLNAFNAPKIKARVENIPLEQAHKALSLEAGYLNRDEIIKYAHDNSPYKVCHEQVCLRPAWPWITQYPGYFIYDWITEVTKTTFDLYSYQFVALHNNCFKWDPLIEYLPTKLAETLYTKPLPWYMRLIAYVELLFEVLVWLGIFVGLWLVMYSKKFRQSYANLWIPCGMMIGAAVVQTGGFGYARLRLPIEPLICLLGIMFWYWFLVLRKKQT